MTRSAPDEAELELWSLLVEKYEEERFPIATPDPIEAIRFRMEQAGLAPADLQPYLQSKSKVSEVMNRKRPLSLSMIRALHRGLQIPAEVLVQETAASYSARRLKPRRNRASA
jgi:HTH-type transcriptional regulator/antitoxin HigA